MGSPQGSMTVHLIRFMVLAVVVAITPLSALAQDGDSNAGAAIRSWEWWKQLSESAREQLAPKLVDLVGKSGASASLAVEAIDNTSRYRALCGRKSGAFRETALCKGLQYKLGERSAWSTTFEALYRRAGTESAAARDSAAILVGLRKELGLEKRKLPAKPQYLLHGLYDVFGRCGPPTCNPGLEKAAKSFEFLAAAAQFTKANGNDAEVTAAKHLQGLGWKQD